MQSFTIRDIENLTGIKAHTLRIWEQRYGFFLPKRKESQHRFYDNEDLKKLLRISFLYHNGWKVSRIAALNEEAIIRELRQTKTAPENSYTYVSWLIEAALDFNESSFLKVLDELKEQLGFEQCMLQVCYPFLQKVGLLWSTNNVIPAQEHFSSYLIQNRIILETENLPAASGKPELVLLCPKGEFHELPLLFMNYLFRLHSWSTLYMGTNIPPDELFQLVEVTGAKKVYVHLITNFTGGSTDDYFENICRRLPESLIIASGEGIRSIQRKFVNLLLLDSNTNIQKFISRKN